MIGDRGYRERVVSIESVDFWKYGSYIPREIFRDRDGFDQPLEEGNALAVKFGDDYESAHDSTTEGSES